MKYVVTNTRSEARGLSPVIPGLGELLEVGDACGANAFGTVHPVQGRPWLLTHVARDTDVRDRLGRLAELHGVLAKKPIEGIHTFFWYGTVEEPSGVGRDHVLLENDVTQLAPTLAETAIPAIPAVTRLRLAASVAETVAAMSDLPATLGRLDAESVRLDPAAGRTLVTGLETAALGPRYRQLVLDFGSSSGHLAPELHDGEEIHAEYADAHTDAWALAVVLHRLLFGFHPYHFMSDLSRDTVHRELVAKGWPGPHVTAEFDDVYHSFPDPLLVLLHRTFEYGWADRRARPTAQEWSTVLEQCTRVPVFAALAVDKRVIAAGDHVTVNWTTRYASHVLTASGRVLPASGKAAFELPVSGPITLQAVGLVERTVGSTPAVLVLRRSLPPQPLRPAVRVAPSTGRPAPSHARLPAVASMPEPARFRPKASPPPVAPRFPPDPK